MDLLKKSALIKFKDIESAGKAGASQDVIFDNPKIKILYTVVEPQVLEPGEISPVKEEPPLYRSSSAKTYLSEEAAKKRKMIE